MNNNSQQSQINILKKRLQAAEHINEGYREMEIQLSKVLSLAHEMSVALWKASNCRIFYEESLDIDPYTTDFCNKVLEKWNEFVKNK